MYKTDDISKMDFKELRNEVQRLSDELSLMKRSYEDILYNLDDENFSGRFLKEKENMKSQISVSEKAIETMVSETDLENELEKFSKTIQTADGISSIVVRKVDLDNAQVVNESYTDIEDVPEKDIAKIYKLSDEYYYYNSISQSWEQLSDDVISSAYEQNAEGFILKGNVVIDGNMVKIKNLEISGNISFDWNDVENAISEVKNQVRKIAIGEYEPTLQSGETTFISGKNIYSPNIYGNEIKVKALVVEKDEDGDGVIEKQYEDGSFSIYGYYNHDEYHFLEIKYGDSIPRITFSSPDGAYATWNFSETSLQGGFKFNNYVDDGGNYTKSSIDFSYATVKGLGVVPVFGEG